MNERAKNNLVVATTMTAIVLVPLLTVVAVLIGARGPDPADSAEPPVSQAIPAATNEVQIKTHATANAPDNPTAMVQQHQPMMDQMRVSVSAAMTDQMNRDPMWQMMRSNASIALLETHEVDIDRMLARNQ